MSYPTESSRKQDESTVNPSKSSAPEGASNHQEFQSQAVEMKTAATIDKTPNNLLFHEFPPPIADASLDQIISIITSYAITLLVCLAAPLWLYFAFGRGFLHFAVISGSISSFAFAIFTAHHLVGVKLTKELKSIQLQMHKQRGTTFSPPTPESAEWLNSFIGVVWTQLNPDLFIAVCVVFFKHPRLITDDST